MMPAPIGNLPARIIQAPPEVYVTTPGCIRRFGRGSQPHFIVEAFGNGLGILTVPRMPEIRRAARQTHQNSFELSNRSIAHDLASLAESHVGPLLAAALEHAIAPLHRVRHRPPLRDS